MARITVEDCVEKIPNRFDVVVLAAKRAREISAGAYITVPRDNDKNPVIALREIAEKSVSFENLKNSIIKSFQRNFVTDDIEKEIEKQNDKNNQLENSDWEAETSNFIQDAENMVYENSFEDNSDIKSED
jgi:DNA-directed RNA polymerase subunit omega